MRTFIAIEFDNETKETLYGYGRKIRLMTKSGDFSYKENIHLTVKFIGEVEEKDIGIIKKIMDDVSSEYGPFDIEFTGFGTFKTGVDHIVWIGIKASDSLIEMCKNVNAALFAKGFKGDNKPFKPHITLGRRVLFEKSMEEIKREIKPKIEPVRVYGMTLMESARVRGRLTYIPLYKSNFLKKGEDEFS